ncbi:MAG: UvrB/UvrC motif-containing protein [Candidatus Handelsmanbacteria bacterium]|nr:UvrB/UvrC motif-containing protein [Candidatus Handelsmanbacteria bacterium]
MNTDLGLILHGWSYARGELRVRKIAGGDGRPRIQIRMDMGLMQLEWSGRPDGARPRDSVSLLDYFQSECHRRQRQGQAAPLLLSRADCWELGQEAMQYYWRRLSFFELKEYLRAEEDATHNLDILDLCQEYAEHPEDRQIAHQYRAFVTAHRIQAGVLSLLEEHDHQGALQHLRTGIGNLEEILSRQGDLEHPDSCQELNFLRQWEQELEHSRPLSPEEKLNVELAQAVEQERFELAASLRDRLRLLQAQRHGDLGSL